MISGFGHVDVIDSILPQVLMFHVEWTGYYHSFLQNLGLENGKRIK